MIGDKHLFNVCLLFFHKKQAKNCKSEKKIVLLQKIAQKQDNII